MPAIAQPPPPTQPNPTPAAPSPARPTTPPVPPTPPKPAPTPAPAAEDDDDPFKEMDEKIFGQKPTAKEPEKKAVEKKEPEPKPGEAKAQEKEKPENFRKELDKYKAEVKAKEEAVTALEAKISDYENRGKDTAALAERLAAAEKRLEEKEAELRVAKAEVSDEFKKKWDKPFDDAAQYAMNEILTLPVGELVEKENEDGTKTKSWQPTGKADWKNHFAGLYALAKEDPSQALARTRQMFGESADIVWSHIRELKRLDHARGIALAEEKAQWKERETAKQAESAKQRELLEAEKTKAQEWFVKQHPEWYAEDPNDPEGNAALAEGRKLTEQQPKTQKEALAFYAVNRLNAMSAVRERHRNKILREENEQLKAKIEELKGGKPGPGARSTTGGETAESEDDLAGLDAIKFGG